MKKIKEQYGISFCDYLYLCIFIIVSAYLLFRVRYGFVEVDEAGYLGLTYRLTQGDRLIIDEWHPSQLWSFLLYPVVAGYRMIHLDMEGVFITFRLLYVVVHLITSSCLYFIFRKYSKTIAIIGFLMFALYSPFEINAFSYNIVALWAIVLLITINIPGKREGISAILCPVVTGILVAALVLCNPFCILLYFFQILYWIYKIKKEKTFPAIKEILFVHIGIFILAFLFLIHIYNGESLFTFVNLLKENVRYVLQDGTHQSKTIKDFFYPIKIYVRDNVLLVVLFFILSIWGTFDKKRRKFIMPGILSETTIFLIYCFVRNDTLCGNLIPAILAPAGLVSFCWLKEKPSKLFHMGYLLSVFYSVLMNCSSNNGMYIIFHGLVIASVFSLLFLYLWIEEQRDGTGFLPIKILFIVLIITTLGFETYNKIQKNFWEADTTDLTAMIQSGPAKGIITTTQKQKRYDQENKEIAEIQHSDNDMFLFFSNRNDGYMIGDTRVGAPSIYVFEEPSPVSLRIEVYYRLHEDRVPRVIYVDSSSVSKLSDDEWRGICTDYGYNLTEEPSGAYLLETN